MKFKFYVLFISCTLVHLSFSQISSDTLLISPVNTIPIANCNNIQVINNKAYIGTDSFLYLVDISSIQNPQFLDSIAVPSETGKIVVKDSLVFVLCKQNGLRIIKISDTHHFQELNYYNAGQDTVFFLDFIIQDSLLYISHSQFGLRVLNMADIYDLKPVLTVSMEEFIIHDPVFYVGPISVSGKYCYLSFAEWNDYDREALAYLAVIDLNDFENPIIIHPNNGLDLGGIPFFLQKKDNYLYLLDFFNGLQIFSITDPGSPILQGGTINNLETWYYGIFIKDDYVYCTSDDYSVYGSLRIYDISDKTNPRQISKFGDNNTTLRELFVDDNYVYVCSSIDTLYIFQTNVPGISINPVLIHFNAAGIDDHLLRLVNIRNIGPDTLTVEAVEKVYNSLISYP